ncbi:MAG: hypothetical protein LBT65_03460 [Synergistaceae bacterium]|nr:hypothetical protein [Synergistaceae bacterium]
MVVTYGDRIRVMELKIAHTERGGDAVKMNVRRFARLFLGLVVVFTSAGAAFDPCQRA